MSHPTWVRGLKLAFRFRCCRCVLSHPTWVRGLKQLLRQPCRPPSHVAPYVGAWIETFSTRFLKFWVRRTLRGCVD